MMKIMDRPNFDFLGVRWAAIGASLLVIAIGMGAVYARGKQLLDIDFTGGSSVTFTLKESASMPIAEVRAALGETELADKNLLIVERGDTNTRYQIDTSEQSVDKVKQIIAQTFGDKLMTYSIEFRDLKTFTEGQFTGTEATISVNKGEGYTSEDGVNHDTLREWLRDMLTKAGHTGIQPTLTNPEVSHRQLHPLQRLDGAIHRYRSGGSAKRLGIFAARNERHTDVSTGQYNWRPRVGKHANPSPLRDRSSVS